jgi:hypothetical protein
MSQTPMITGVGYCTEEYQKYEVQSTSTAHSKKTRRAAKQDHQFPRTQELTKPLNHLGAGVGCYQGQAK